MSVALQNKKILFLSPAFFNYEYIIKKKMECMGATVSFYDERVVKTAWERALLKKTPFLFNKRSEKYFEKIIIENRHKIFDYVLIIRCDLVSEKTLQKLKKTFPKAKFCLYLWDSLSNIPGIEKKIKYFDRATSFDKRDCLSNAKLVFRPLFFSDEFSNMCKKQRYKYDVAFCGTVHSDRYKVLNKIEEDCKKKNLRYLGFYYLQSKFIYFFYKATKRSFKSAMYSKFCFQKKSQEELAEIENSTRVIIDIQHPTQTGLTMRTIEMLGLKKKIITTNKDIINYDFYNSHNIYIVDRENPQIDKEFVFLPYEEIPKNIYDKYTLKNWIIDVLDGGQIDEDISNRC